MARPDSHVTSHSLQAAFEEIEDRLDTGVSTDALRSAGRLVRRLRRELPANRLLLMRALCLYGDTCLAAARPAAAIDAYEEALAEDRAEALGESRADVLAQLARAYQDRRQFAKAEVLHRQAIAGSPPRSVDRATRWNNLAEMYRLQGEYLQAERVFIRAMSEHRAAGAPALAWAGLFNNLGELYREIDYVRPARTLLQEARRLYQQESPSASSSRAAVLNNLALVEQALGNSGAAGRLLRESLTIWKRLHGPRHVHVALALHNLAQLHADAHQWETAEAEYRTARSILRSRLDASDPALQIVTAHLASLFAQTGRPSLAVRLLRRAITDTHAGNGTTPTLLMNDLAELFRTSGRTAQAEQLYREAIAIDRRTLGRWHPAVATGYRNLGLLLGSTGRTRQALELFERAARIETVALARAFGAGSERERLAIAAELEGGLATYISLVLDHPGRSARRVHALEAALRRKQLTAEAITIARDADDAVVHRDQHWALTNLQHELSALAVTGGSGKHQAARIRRLQQEQQRLEADLATRFPMEQFGERIAHVTAARLQEVLPDSAVLVDFLRLPRYRFHSDDLTDPWSASVYVAFICRRQGPPQLVEIGPAGQIDSACAKFRAAAAAPFLARVAGHSLDQWGLKLWQLLIEPMQTHLRDASRLLISPDSALNLLPFEALPWPPDSRFIDRFEITYLATPRDLLISPDISAVPAGPALVIGDPDFEFGPTANDGQHPSCEAANHSGAVRSGKGSAPGNVPIGPIRRLGSPHSPFQRMRATEREAQMVGSVLGVEPVLGKNATKQRLLAVRSPTVLHLATHAYFLPSSDADKGVARAVADTPLLRAGIALAGANAAVRGENEPASDLGIITGAEITRLDLRACELVVLSGCETGLGDVHAGEGVFGLRRAFALAGAQSLVMSLWAVPDPETAELMISFYDALKCGSPPSAALRAAKLEMKTRHRHPYYWASFLCQGGNTPLRTLTIAR